MGMDRRNRLIVFVGLILLKYMRNFCNAELFATESSECT